MNFKTTILILLATINAVTTFIITESLVMTAILIVCMFLVCSVFSSVKNNKEKFEKPGENPPTL